VIWALALTLCSGVVYGDEHPEDGLVTEHAGPSECNMRSMDGCLCVDEDKVIDWRAKALAYEELTNNPPVICVEPDGTGSRSLWAALTGVAVVVVNLLVNHTPVP